jgi:hypothetical protein
MLGDRVIKSDSPLVSSKIDFADFLGLIVNIKLNLGGQIKLNGNEIIINGELQSF